MTDQLDQRGFPVPGEEVTGEPVPAADADRADRADGRAARWFARFTQAIHAGLPGRLRRIVPVTFIGYGIINGTAFGVDMAFLSLFHGSAQIPYPLAVTLGYVVASAASFLVNRWLNFRETTELGKQTSKYVVVIVSNYLLWILLFSSLLEALGVHYQVARVVAACIEGLYIYTLMRLWVFPRRGSHWE